MSIIPLFLDVELEVKVRMELSLGWSMEVEFLVVPATM